MRNNLSSTQVVIPESNITTNQVKRSLEKELYEMVEIIFLLCRNTLVRTASH